MAEIAFSTVVSAGAFLNEAACAASACLINARTGRELKTVKGDRRILRILAPVPSSKPSGSSSAFPLAKNSVTQSGYPAMEITSSDALAVGPKAKINALWLS